MCRKNVCIVFSQLSKRLFLSITYASTWRLAAPVRADVDIFDRAQAVFERLAAARMGPNVLPEAQLAGITCPTWLKSDSQQVNKVTVRASGLEMQGVRRLRLAMLVSRTRPAL